jgi:phage terminase large subunit-like protein
MAGRGFGKTRTGAEWAREQVMYGNRRIGHFIAPTAADARDVMIEGPAGFLKCCEAFGWKAKYYPSRTQIVCPNGAVINIYSAEEPERLRGPQCDFLWADEIATWKNAAYVWDMAMFGLRLGENPQGLATTTPRPVPLVKSILADTRSEANPEGGTVVTGGSTYENAANLAKTFLRKIVRKYEGTRLGNQELLGQMLLDIPGALWSAELIERARILLRDDDPNPPLSDMDIYKMAVGVDPMAKDPNKEEDLDNPAETGIVVAGLGPLDHAYVFDDSSMPGTPAEWGAAVVRAYHKWRADYVVAEANNGGMMVQHVIHSIDPNVPVHLVHASRGKITRAEPISSFYEQLRVRHVGQFPKLEEQMTTYTGASAEHSPDRMDALVWVLTDLLVGLSAPELNDDTQAAFDWTAEASNWRMR